MKSDFMCGSSFCHPKWLQKFTNARTFIIVYGFLGTAQAMATVYFLITLTTLEKQFKIPGQILGFILSGNEIAQILLSLALSYIGGQRNRPKWIAWGVLCCALSCFILAAPHFIYGAGDDILQLTKEYADNFNFDDLNNTYSELMKSQNHLCSSANYAAEECQEAFAVFPLVLIFLSQFVLGIGNTLYYSLGQSYLDDNTDRVKTPLMLGYAMGLRLLGPGVAFFLGREALRIFVDPSKTPLIDSKDPRWVGAWWLGWLILGSAMLIIAVFIGMFPKELPRRQTVKDHLQKFIADMQITLLKDKPQSKRPTLEINVPFTEFLVALKRLLKNKLLMFNTASGVFYLLGSLGYMTYLNKYFEVQFHKNKADATIISGPVTLFGMLSGFLVSGIVISKKKPGPKLILLWNVIGGVIYMLGQLSYLFLTCPDEKMPITGGSLNLSTSCNWDCNCDTLSYNPVCHDQSGITFFSPCHAGCNAFDSKNKVYSQCNCVDGGHTLSADAALDKINQNILKPGACLNDCAIGFYGFTLVSMVINFLDTSGRIGNLLVNYRCVATRDKSFAQGLILMTISLFALIPGPIIYGYIMDSTCLIWTEKCGKRGNCQLYDQKNFRYFVNFVALVLTSIGVIFDILVWHHGKNLIFYDEEKTLEGAEGQAEDANEHIEIRSLASDL